MTTRNPLFQQRHYAELARILASAPISSPQRRDIAHWFASELKRGSCAFNTDKFLSAVYGKPGTGRDNPK